MFEEYEQQSYEELTSAIKKVDSERLQVSHPHPLDCQLLDYNSDPLIDEKPKMSATFLPFISLRCNFKTKPALILC